MRTGSNAASISIPLGLTNLGNENESCTLKIISSSYFRPSLSIPGWDYSTNSVQTSVAPGEQLNFTLIPQLSHICSWDLYDRSRRLFRERGPFRYLHIDIQCEHERGRYA